MENETLAFIASFIAVICVVVAYFMKKKELYLLGQSLCIVFLILSYFFDANFFGMIGLSIGLARSLTFFLYEKQDKNAPIFWSFFFSVLTIASYFIVNVWILQNAQPADLLCMVSLVMYAFIFRIRSLKIVRFTMLAPTTMAIAYNVLVSAALFATLTYVFELCVNLIAIARFHALPYFAEKHKRQESVLNEEELKQGEI